MPWTPNYERLPNDQLPLSTVAEDLRTLQGLMIAAVEKEHHDMNGVNAGKHRHVTLTPGTQSLSKAALGVESYGGKNELVFYDKGKSIKGQLTENGRPAGLRCMMGLTDWYDIPAGSDPTIIKYDTALSNPYSDYDPATGKYTVPYAGIYLVTECNYNRYTTGSSAPTSPLIYIERGGSVVSNTWASSPGYTLPLAKGDLISIRVPTNPILILRLANPLDDGGVTIHRNLMAVYLIMRTGA